MLSKGGTTEDDPRQKLAQRLVKFNNPTYQNVPVRGQTWSVHNLNAQRNNLFALDSF